MNAHSRYTHLAPRKELFLQPLAIYIADWSETPNLLTPGDPLISVRDWPSARSDDAKISRHPRLTMIIMTELPTFDPQPITLEGTHARLEPLAESHLPDLLECGRAEEIWHFMPCKVFRSPDDTRRWFDESQQELKSGNQVPFAIIHRESGRAVGSTRFLEIRRAHRGLEIGWTWIGREFQRTAINTECKLLLLRHAFETLGAIRVQFKTDRRNERSQRAIERIGAVHEGTLKHHMIMPDGKLRDSVYYAVTQDTWPDVKQRLTQLKQRTSSTPS
jgi:RimJ/RimL family protein N-acetyltransferase